MNINEIGNKKSFIQVFATERDESKLKHSDLLVYSYLRFQATYRNTPTNLVLASKTGLDRNTITGTLTRLTECGLVKEGRAVPPADMKEWFRPAKNKRGFSTWDCFTRSEHSPLTVAATSLISWLWHLANTSYTPPRWSLNYIATCTNLSNGTVESSLRLLANHYFVKYDENYKIKINSKLTAEQLAYFQDQPVTKSMENPLELEDFDVPEVIALEQKVDPSPLKKSEPVCENDDETFDPKPAPVNLRDLGVDDDNEGELDALSIGRYLTEKLGNDNLGYKVVCRMKDRKVSEWRVVADEVIAQYATKA